MYVCKSTSPRFVRLAQQRRTRASEDPHPLPIRTTRLGAAAPDPQTPGPPDGAHTDPRANPRLRVLLIRATLRRGRSGALLILRPSPSPAANPGGMERNDPLVDA
eukprot:1150050-Prorocentrum_minimum.AAC.1